MTPDAAERRARALLDGHSLARDAAPDLARDVLALAAALRTERAAREAAEAQHAALAGAVRAEREASHARIAGELSGAAMVRARAATDALLRGAPCGYVEAPLVREYLAAVEAFDGGALGAPCRASIRVDNTRAALVAALEK